MQSGRNTVKAGCGATLFPHSHGPGVHVKQVIAVFMNLVVVRSALYNTGTCSVQQRQKQWHCTSCGRR